MSKVLQQVLILDLIGVYWYEQLKIQLLVQKAYLNNLVSCPALRDSVNQCKHYNNRLFGGSTKTVLSDSSLSMSSPRTGDYIKILI